MDTLRSPQLRGGLRQRCRLRRSITTVAAVALVVSMLMAGCLSVRATPSLSPPGRPTFLADPIPVHPNASHVVNKTTNWSQGGYADTTNWAGAVLTYDPVSAWPQSGNMGGPFIGVTATFKVPSLVCPAHGTLWVSIWAGLDGFAPYSSTVEQAGVDGRCAGGTASYFAWYEFFPAASIAINTRTHPVAAGDTIGVVIQVDTQHAQVAALVNDLAWNGPGQVDWQGGGISSSGLAFNTAECIVEAPLVSTGTAALADFQSVGFGYGDAGAIAGSVADACAASVQGGQLGYLFDAFGWFGGFWQGYVYGYQLWGVTMVGVSNGALVKASWGYVYDGGYPYWGTIPGPHADTFPVTWNAAGP